MITIIQHILSKHNRIGVFVSGGFDSAMLYYLIRLYRTDQKITVFVIDRPNNSLKYSKAVIDWIDNKFGTPAEIEIVGKPSSPHHFHIVTGILEARQMGLDIVLLGDTANPIELPGGPERPMSTNSFVEQPFVNFTKDKLVQLAYNLGVQELLDISHSCEMPGDPCGQCWHCKEKDWAIGRSYKN